MKEFSSFRLDPVNQCLWRRTGSGDDERVLLSPSEFGVLDHLVNNAGRLVTHRELLDAVWPRTVIEPQAVKSKIFQLRRVLDDDPKQPRFIETLPRRGYRFLAKIERRRTDDESLGAPPASELVGRDIALAELRRCLQNASAGNLQVVFITGEAGIGKTALIGEFQQQVAASHLTMRLARGQCVEGFGSKEAFYPVLAAVGELCKGPDAARVIEILIAYAPTWLVQFPALLNDSLREKLRHELLGATRERMLREICQALEAIAATTPLVLVLEDLHWADPSTLDLVSALSRQRSPAKIMLIATYRPTDVARASQPLHSLKRDLVARHLCREIILQPLTEREIARYLAPNDATTEVMELAALLHRHTEGNPLFMTAVLEHLVQQRLAENDRGWRLLRDASEISFEVPGTLREMIAAQIDALTDHEQRSVEVGAIAGMTFAPAISARSADMDIDQFEASCESLARRGHILRIGGTREIPGKLAVQLYTFTHALYREVLYERQTPARRAHLHRRRGEELESAFADSRDEVTAELALHFEKGADYSRAVSYLRRAADIAVDRCALEEAKANLLRALELAGKLPIPERAYAQCEILDMLAQLYLGSFDARAVDALTLLHERAASNGLIDFQVKSLVDLIYPLAWVNGERALSVIEQALTLSEAQADPLKRARTRARCMMQRIWTRGWSDDDSAQCANALAEIRQRAEPQQAAWHIIDCNLLNFFSSRYRQVMNETTAALAVLVQAHRGSMYLSYPYSVREYTVPWCLTLLGGWGSALREFEAGIALAEKNGDPLRGQTLLLFRCWTLFFAMDFHALRTASDSLLPSFAEPSRAPWRRLSLTFAGAAEVGLGLYEEARNHLLVAREEMDRHATLGDWYWRLLLQLSLSNLWLGTGDLERAHAESELLLASALATQERTWQALASEVNARIALQMGDVRRAHDFVTTGLKALEGFEGPVAEWQVHATAADVAEARRDSISAFRHRDASRTIVRTLADSLAPNEPQLLQTFTAAPAVAKVLGQRSTKR